MGQSQNPYADQLSAALGQDALQLPEYEPSAELNTAIKKLYKERDPDAAAAKARELFRDTENREMNTEQLTRLDDMRKRNVESRNSFDVFSELLGGIASDGLGGAGKAGRAIETRRKQEEKDYETKRMSIQTARKNINETMGKEALASYDKAETQNRNDDRAIVTALDGLDERKRATLLKNVELQSTQRGQNITALVGLTQRQESILNRKEGEGLRNIQEQVAATEGIFAMETAITNLTSAIEERYLNRIDQNIRRKIDIGGVIEPEEQAAIDAARKEALLDEGYLATRAEMVKRKETFQRLADSYGAGNISSASSAGAAINAKKDG